MNNKYKDEQLFEVLKTIPPEISEAKVHSIIKTLPLLPIPKTHWIHQINLNSIIMSTTVITFIVGATLLLTNVNHPETLMENIQPLEETTAAIVAEEKVAEKKESIELETSATEDVVMRKRATITQLPQQNISSIVSISTSDYDLPELLPLPKVTPPQIIDTSELIADIAAREHEWFSIDLSLEPCRRTPKISDSGIKLLKISLLNKLKKDQVITSKKDKMILSFNKNGVLVNDQLLANSLQEKYLEFLESYNITPCANRLLITTSEYIAVGNHTKEGFKGHIDGRVDLGELNLYQGYGTSLFPQKEERQIGDFHSLKVEGLAVVYLSNSPSPTAKLKVSGIPIEDVLTKVVDGVLTIDTKGQHNGEKISIEIGVTNLKAIEVGGSAELRSEEQLVSETLDIHVLDTGSAWLDVKVEHLTIWMKGGDLFIKGEANSENTILKFEKNHESGILDYSGLKSK